MSDRKKQRRPRKPVKPRLSCEQILRWAKDHHRRTGQWPKAYSGAIRGTDENWTKIENALRLGLRGLEGGTTLSRLLDEHLAGQGRRRYHRGRLTVRQIYEWAKEYHARTGHWPTFKSGVVAAAPEETWASLTAAVAKGKRGLPKGLTLAKLLTRMVGPTKRLQRPALSYGQIREWAKAHYLRFGVWPTADSGPVFGQTGETWKAINMASKMGYRGLPPGVPLGQLLGERVCGLVRQPRYPQLTLDKILRLADRYHRRSGYWPTSETREEEPDLAGMSWQSINDDLRAGRRGLPGGSSLAQLLAEHRGVPIGKSYARRPRRRVPVPDLTVEEILKAADAYRRENGEWPGMYSGRVPSLPFTSWKGIDRALKDGLRGLPGGSSLIWFLHEHRGRHYGTTAPPLTIEQILAWADAYHRRTDEWPHERSKGPVPGAPRETWRRVGGALETGGRGLPHGWTLARLLTEHRGVRNHRGLPPLTEKQILRWADAHHRRTGEWPTTKDRDIPEAPGETWASVAHALRTGRRGLSGRRSFGQLLCQERNVRSGRSVPSLSIEQILRWAREHQQRTGRRPTRKSGPVHGAPGETWTLVNNALTYGHRELPRGGSLQRLLAERLPLSPTEAAEKTLSHEQILGWAADHYRRTGRWPSKESGPIVAAPGRTWGGIHQAMMNGRFGLPRGFTLARLLAEMKEQLPPRGGRIGRDSGKGGCENPPKADSHQGTRVRLRPRPRAAERPPRTLSVREIRMWARAYYRRMGEWPERYSGRIPDAPGETWLKIDEALQRGTRGLTGGSSLKKLLARRRKPSPIAALLARIARGRHRT